MLVLKINILFIKQLSNNKLSMKLSGMPYEKIAFLAFKKTKEAKNKEIANKLR